MKPIRRIWRVFFLLGLVFSCKSLPAPAPAVHEEIPASRLEFDHIEAETIQKISLFFKLVAPNSRTSLLKTEIKNWKAELDGRALGKDAAELHFENIPGGAPEIPLRLDIDLAKCPLEPEELDVRLTVNVDYHFSKDRSSPGTVSAGAVFPRIREPVFTITSIAILQAELINTRFRVNLRIDNPNFFPVDLSSFGYELYGEGRFWAGGEERDVLHIPAKSSDETKLFLLMNFIDMKRNLLDEVVAMNLVRYRFRGEVLVGTGVEYLPAFDMAFDKSGMSEVFK
ncbi:MAG: LEA type 2 family protein [Treponema sp.]|nr:LEA type 2 family protein [Treponema sp.]